MATKPRLPKTQERLSQDSIKQYVNAETGVPVNGKAGLSQVKDRAGNNKFEEPAFAFRRKVESGGRVNPAPLLVDADGNKLDVSVGNGSEVKVKFKPYSSKYGTFAELIAVKVNKLVEYSEPDSDNEEF